MDPNQQPQQPLQPQQSQQPSQASSPQEQQPATVSTQSAVSASSKPKGSSLKTTGGVLSIIAGLLTLPGGLIGLSVNFIFGILALALAVSWIVLGAKALSSEGAKATKALQNVAKLAIGYAGILFFLSLFVPGFRLSAVLLPFVFAVTITIIANKLAVQDKIAS